MLDKKKIKREYKETVQPLGIFRVRNRENGRIFLGSTLNLLAQKNSIFFQLEMKTHMNEALQEDFNRFGKEAFEFEVIDTLEPNQEPGVDYREDLDCLLQIWIEKLQNEIEQGYNKISISSDGKRKIW